MKKIKKFTIFILARNIQLISYCVNNINDNMQQLLRRNKSNASPSIVNVHTAMFS
jgi:primosomal protein N''